MADQRIQISQKKKVKKQLGDIPESNREKIKETIKSLADDPLPPGIEKLGKHIYRVRWGNYRIIYQFPNDNKGITVLYVGDRKDIYQRAQW